MGGCVSVHRNNHLDSKLGKNLKKKRSSYKTRFKGLPPEEVEDDRASSAQEQQQQQHLRAPPSIGSSSERKTLGSILSEIREPSEHDQSQGSREEAWFDAEGRFVSDSDDEFMSVCGDLASAGNSLSLPRSNPATPRPTFATLKEQMQLTVNTQPSSPPSFSTTNGFHTPSSNNNNNKLQNSEEEKRSSVSLGRRLESTTPRNSSVSVAPVSDASAELEPNKPSTNGQHPKSEFEGCLPCLLNSVGSFDKRSPQRRKSFRLFSFKRRSDLNDLLDLHDMSKVLHRPVAGSQVPMSDGSGEGSWSRISPSSFRLRSKNYPKDKKKQLASELSIFDAAAVDVFLTPKKVEHIARFVDLSALIDTSQASSGKFPQLFIFNIQVPMYTASVFPSENNGEGLSLVFYYKLSEAFLRDGPPYLKEMLTRLLDDDQEKIRGLVAESIVPFRERLKIVARVLNPDEIHLSAPERKLVVTYNEKPVLSRPQHSFFKGPNYFEVDLDVHRFNFIARKAVESFRERLKLCVLDIGLTIQGNKAEELPEYVLCCARINKLNISSYKFLEI